MTATIDEDEEPKQRVALRKTRARPLLYSNKAYSTNESISSASSANKQKRSATAYANKMPKIYINNNLTPSNIKIQVTPLME